MTWLKIVIRTRTHLIGKKADKAEVERLEKNMPEGVPKGYTADQQLVTDADGVTMWENKPFGESMVTLVDCEINAEYSSYFGYSDALLKPGYSRPALDEEFVEDMWLMPGDLIAEQTYIVTYDGVKYEMVARNISDDPTNPNVVLGNYDSENSSVLEPFYLCPGFGPYMFRIPFALGEAGQTKHTVKIETMEVKTLDPKYLPEPELVVNFTLNESFCSADKTFDEVAAAIIAGKPVRGVFHDNSGVLSLAHMPCKLSGYDSDNPNFMMFDGTLWDSENGNVHVITVSMISNGNMMWGHNMFTLGAAE
jgi:hypothetical protein